MSCEQFANAQSSSAFTHKDKSGGDKMGEIPPGFIKVDSARFGELRRHYETFQFVPLFEPDPNLVLADPVGLTADDQ